MIDKIFNYIQIRQIYPNKLDKQLITMYDIYS